MPQTTVGRINFVLVVLIAAVVAGASLWVVAVVSLAGVAWAATTAIRPKSLAAPPAAAIDEASQTFPVFALAPPTPSLELPSPPDPPARQPSLATGRGCFVEVVVEPFCQGTLRTLAKAHKEYPPEGREIDRDLQYVHDFADGEEWRVFTAELAPAPDDERDPNAVAVHAQGFGPIGYLSRQNAEAYQLVLLALRERGVSLSCPGKLVGGTPNRRHYGAYLDLAPPITLESRFGLTRQRGTREGPPPAPGA